MAWFSADLHIHSCLSPCGDLSASPKLIVEYALEAGLDLIALTDHNTAKNCPALAYHAGIMGLNVLFGSEASSAEDVHGLCLFEALEDGLAFGDFLYEHLPAIRNTPENFGDQVVVDAEDEIIEELQKLLITATDIGISDLCREVHAHGGLYIPAHADRSAMSCLSQLGYVPPEPFDGLELLKASTTLEALNLGGPLRKGQTRPPHRYAKDSLPLPQDMATNLLSILEERKLMPSLAWQRALTQGTPLPLAITASSDAHAPEYIGQRQTLFWAQEPNFYGFKTALAKGWALGVWRLGV